MDHFNQKGDVWIGDANLSWARPPSCICDEGAYLYTLEKSEDGRVYLIVGVKRLPTSILETIKTQVIEGGGSCHIKGIQLHIDMYHVFKTLDDGRVCIDYGSNDVHQESRGKIYDIVDTMTDKLEGEPQMTRSHALPCPNTRRVYKVTSLNELLTGLSDAWKLLVSEPSTQAAEAMKTFQTQVQKLEERLSMGKHLSLMEYHFKLANMVVLECKNISLSLLRENRGNYILKCEKFAHRIPLKIIKESKWLVYVATEDDSIVGRGADDFYHRGKDGEFIFSLSTIDLSQSGSKFISLTDHGNGKKIEVFVDKDANAPGRDNDLASGEVKKSLFEALEIKEFGMVHGHSQQKRKIDDDSSSSSASSSAKKACVAEPGDLSKITMSPFPAPVPDPFEELLKESQNMEVGKLRILLKVVIRDFKALHEKKPKNSSQSGKHIAKRWSDEAFGMFFAKSLLPY